jgi:hypothetical protein
MCIKRNKRRLSVVVERSERSESGGFKRGGYKME